MPAPGPVRHGGAGRPSMTCLASQQHLSLQAAAIMTADALHVPARDVDLPSYAFLWGR